MIFVILLSGISSIMVIEVNQQEYTGDTFDDILNSYGAGIDTITSLNVKSGDFPLNLIISNSFTSLLTLEIHIDSFTGIISDNLMKGCVLISSVIIDGATIIGEKAFAECSALYNIKFSSCEHIKDSAFQSCVSLASITLPNVKIIDNYGFSNTDLSSIELPLINTINDYAFSDCIHLSILNAPLINYIGSYCFKSCAFVSLTLNNLLEMSEDGYCFDSCTFLENIQLNQIEKISKYAFNGCSNLNTIIGEKVKIIEEGCFSGCSLSTLNLPELKTIGIASFKDIPTIKEINFLKVENIESSAFQNCINLETVVLKVCISIGNNAFNGCKSLTRVEIPILQSISYAAFRNIGVTQLTFNELENFELGNIDGTNNVGGYFMGCNNLNSFSAQKARSIPAWMFKDCTSLLNLNMDNAQTIGSNAFSGCSVLTNLILQKINKIEDNAFSGYNNLVYVKMISVITIGESSFMDCQSLEKVEFSNVTSIGYYCFKNCVKLSEISMPSLTSISSDAFYKTALVHVELNKLVTIVIRNVYGSGNFANCFEGCSHLKSISLHALTYFKKWMFKDCSVLESIDAPEVVSTDSSTFSGCSSLCNITFPKLQTIDESAFAGCQGIQNITLDSVITIGVAAFEGCVNLISIDLINCITINSKGFSGCSKLTLIKIPSVQTINDRAFQYTSIENVILQNVISFGTYNVYGEGNVGSQFEGCELLKSISMPLVNNLRKWMFKNCYSLIDINAPNVTVIDEKTFTGCTSYSNIDFPILNYIGNSAFANLPNLTIINSPVQTIAQNAFEGCNNLITVILPNCVTIDNYAFYNCIQLSSINAPLVTKLGTDAFYKCVFIEVTFNNVIELSTRSVYGQGNVGCQFDRCSVLKKITMKNTPIIRKWMFRDCTQLIYIDTPVVTTIDGSAFVRCHSYTNVTFPIVNYIGEYAFSEISSLTTISLSSLITIDNYAFNSCPKLTSVEIIECTNIGNYAFANCIQLKNIIAPKLNSIGTDAFYKCVFIEVTFNNVIELSTRSVYGQGNVGCQFDGCSVLQKVSFENVPILRKWMFRDCIQLIEVNAKHCTSIDEYCFSNCQKLTILELDSCTYMGTNAFSDCNNIKTISLGYQSIEFGVIPSPKILENVFFPNALNVPENGFLDFTAMKKCKLPLVTKLGSFAFSGCISLVELEIPKIQEFQGDYIFSNCENIESLSLKFLVTVDSTSANIFKGCRGLKTISMPDRPPLTFHRDTFLSLTCDIVIPPESINIYDNDINVEGDTAGDNHWCGLELKHYEWINISADNSFGIGITLYDACLATGKVTSEINQLTIFNGHLTNEVLNTFKDTFVTLTDLIIESSASIENQIIPDNFLKNHQKIQNINIKCGIRLIGTSSFEGCINLQSINIPNTKELSSRCFYGPTSLEIISFPFVDTITGSHFFSNNLNLKNIELPNLTKVNDIGYISENSPNIKSIQLSGTPPIVQGSFLFDSNPLLIGITNEEAIQYDKADGIDNNMKFYSLILSYTIISCLIDGEIVNGLTLKSIINEDSKIVEIIKGKISGSDFPLPSSITSLTIPSNVIIEEIPSNAMSNNINLKYITILYDGTYSIGEEAFCGCLSLENVIITATSMYSSAFKDCIKLKTIVLNKLQNIIGNNHFNNCNELLSISLKELKTVPSDANSIFSGCHKLKTLNFPSIPPNTFNKNVFVGLEEQLSLILPSENDYLTYDNNNLVEDDKENDGLWCGLIIPSVLIGIKINGQNKIITGMKLSDCILSSGISELSINTLEIIKGILTINSILESITKLSFLENLIISKTVTLKDELTDSIFSGLPLISITLPGITKIPQNCFKDCIQLKNVIIEDAKILCDSAFSGCKSIESISLNIITLEGDNHFSGCTSLTSISLINLQNVNSDSCNIFKDCPLNSIYLPNIPPKTFNKDTFKGKDIIILGLKNDELRLYDSNIDVEDDLSDDLKWCGIGLIQLYITVSINDGESLNSDTLINAAKISGITEVKKVEIQKGLIKQSHLNELHTEFPLLTEISILESAVLESSIIESEQFKDIKTLTKVKIMKSVSLMKECFSGCTLLQYIEFKETKVINFGAFLGCNLLSTIIIPGCLQLNGDQIFSGCNNLREIDLSSLENVDNTASLIFQDCNQLIRIKLPSKQPTTFHKDSFINCPNIQLELPNKDDYLIYDDQSNVVDDIKEDEKWCGINIDSNLLPPMKIFKINGIEYKSRKLSLNLYTNDNVETLELIGGLIEANDLRDVLKDCLTLIKFEANIATISEIQSGTFTNCISLTEIIIHGEVTFAYGVLQNLPNLTKLVLDLQQTMRSDDLIGDYNLQEVSIPLLVSIPNNLFANLTKLKSINVEYANIMSSNCFMNCSSLLSISLPKISIMIGDNHFNGCTNLESIDLSSISTVNQDSSNIFNNCIKLKELKLGIKPPTTFNENIFVNAGKLPIIKLPIEAAWNNYLEQCTINPENNHYLWYGFDNGIIYQEPTEITIPECSCPEQSEISCPEYTEISCQECSCSEEPESSYAPITVEEGHSSAVLAVSIVVCIIGASTLTVLVMFIIYKKKKERFSNKIDP